MAEELGKIEKPAAEGFKSARKLYFVPLIISARDLPLEIAVKIDRYWDEVAEHLNNLESKLGKIQRIYHELVPQGGAEGIKLLGELKFGSQNLVQGFVDKGAALEAAEDNEELAELMDWSRCLSLNLQSQNVFAKVVQYYDEANKKRNAGIAHRLDQSLQPNEGGILIMAEGHQIQFPADVQLFYVAPPSLDEVKRWLRDSEQKAAKEAAQNPPKSEEEDKPSSP